MGNITSFFKDAGNFVADWRIWLVSAIVATVLTQSFKTTSKANVFRYVAKTIVMTFIITYVAILALNIWICMEKHNDIDFMKILKDKQTWEDGLYTTLAFVGIVAAAGMASVKFGGARFFQIILWLGITAGFYFTYSIYREIVSCKTYRPDNDE